MVPRPCGINRSQQPGIGRGFQASASNSLGPRLIGVMTSSGQAASRLTILGLLLLAACARKNSDLRVADDARAGATEITRYACGSCHEIPGIEEADGRVGPSLRHFAVRQTIAGRLSNTSENLRRWLKSPQSIVPGNAMPDQGLSDRDAREIAAYLDRLR
jgi:cytochrome c